MGDKFYLNDVVMIVMEVAVVVVMAVVMIMVILVVACKRGACSTYKLCLIMTIC